MIESPKNGETSSELIKAFRAYLQTVITAEQFGQKARLSALPGPKTINYCESLSKLPDNTLAVELATPVWAVIEQMDRVSTDLFRLLSAAKFRVHRPLFRIRLVKHVFAN